MRIKLYFFILLLLVMGSCEEQLELQPHRSLSKEKLFGDPEAAEGVLSETYGWYRSHYRLFSWPDVYGDNHMHVGGNSDRFIALNNLVYNPSNSRILGLWQAYYYMVSSANLLLDNLNLITGINERRKSQMIGEAKLMRAYAYFMLVRTFGKVPLILEQVEGLNDPNMYPNRSEINNIYDQMIDDGTDAAARLPIKGEDPLFQQDFVRVTKGAALAFLSELYLTAALTLEDDNKQEYLNMAKAVNDTLIKGLAGSYELLDNYDELWSWDNKKNGEFIWQVMQSDIGEHNGGNLAGLGNPGAGVVWFIPNNDAILLYNLHDKRFDSNFLYWRDAKDDYPNLQKVDTVSFYMNKYSYKRVSNMTYNWQNYNVYIYRLGGVMLLRAEILTQIDYVAHQDEILDMLNTVRKRAWDPTVDYSEYEITSADYNAKEDLVNIILEERQRELYFEWKRFFDLQRYGKEKEELNLQDKHLLLPVPQTEIDNNQNLLPQNEGW